MSCTIDKLREMVARCPLTSGKHEEGEGKWCILEARSRCAGIEWTDDPELNRTFDIRPIDDIGVSDSLKSKWMLRVMEAYEGSLDWLPERQVAVASKIVELTAVSRLFAMPQSEAVADSALEAKECAEAGAPYAAARAAAVAARAAAADVSPAKRKRLFVTTCQLWIEAAANANAK